MHLGKSRSTRLVCICQLFSLVYAQNTAYKKYKDCSWICSPLKDPVAYRCSIQGRFSYQYESAVAKKAKVKRIAFHCKDLNISLTDIQIPMFARVCELIHAYIKGDIGVHGSDHDEDHLQEPSDECEGLSCFFSFELLSQDFLFRIEAEYCRFK